MTDDNVSAQAEELKKQLLSREKDIKALEQAYIELDIQIKERTAELYKTKELYSDLYNNSPDMYVSVNAETTLIEKCNQTLANKLGYTQEEILGKPIFELYHPDCMPDVQKAFQSFLSTGEVHNAELQLKTKDGNRIDVNLNVTAIKDASGKILKSRSCWVDISHHKAYEAELEQKEKLLEEQNNKYYSMLENLNAISWELDLSDTSFIYVSPNAERILGYPAHDWVDMESWVNMVVEEDRDFAAKHCELETAAGRDHTFEYRMKKKSGEIIWVLDVISVIKDEQGQPCKLTGFILDNNEQHLLKEDLKLSASVFTHASEGITITNASGKILDVNEAFTLITGYQREEVIGKNPSVLQSGRHDDDYYEKMWDDLGNTGRWYGEIWNRRKSGEVYAEMLSINAVKDEEGHTKHYVALFSDITHQKAQQKQLEHIAHYDALTNLPNRVLLSDRLHQDMAHAVRRESQLAVTYLDLDGFKQINDEHGHDVGDELLIVIARRLREALRDGDTIARIGGDEFVAILIDLSITTDCIPLLQRLLSAASKPVIINGLSLKVSASLGVTFYPQQSKETDPDQLLRQADHAMYQAKQAGKNRYKFFDHEQDRTIRGHHNSVKGIREAFNNHEFILYYQPKVNLRTGKVIGLEALIRWHHPEKGILPPASFLPVIEEEQISVDIGDWVIQQAVADLNSWHQKGYPIAVSVNISALHLQQANFSERLFHHLSHSSIDNSFLELEVLETSALEDVTAVSEIIHKCQEYGVKFALDDFGTGYSSLTYLKQLPASTLKIDQTFVRDMLEDPDDLAILVGVLGLSTAFRREVIAEGVETEQHCQMLLKLGCDCVQGYGIARPMPTDTVLNWLTQWHAKPEWQNIAKAVQSDHALLFATVEHRSWIKKIIKCIEDKTPPPDKLDFSNCQFGKWLKSEGMDKYGHLENFKVIIPLHKDIHDLASDICDTYSVLSEDGNKIKVDKLCQYRDDLLNQIQKLVNDSNKKSA